MSGVEPEGTAKDTRVSAAERPCDAAGMLVTCAWNKKYYMYMQPCHPKDFLGYTCLMSMLQGMGSIDSATRTASKSYTTQ